MQQLKVQSVANDVPKPDMNKWFNEFKVSSRYEEKPNSNNRHAFEINTFKNKIKKGLILAD